MKTTNQLKDRLTRIIDMINYTNKLCQDSYCMLITDSSEKHSLINRDKFLRRIQVSLWQLAVIELNKLFSKSDNDKFRLDKLLNKMINDYKDSEWKQDISKKELNRLLNKFNEPKILSLKEKITTLRDKFYAHTDETKNEDIYNIKFYFEDFFYLISSAKVIIKEVMNKVIDIDFDFKNYNGEDVNLFLDRHIEYRKNSAISHIQKK